MHRIDGVLVLSASDLTGFLACEHLSQLELGATRGEHARPERLDPELDVLTRRGLEHELAYLAVLEGQGRSVARIDTGADPYSLKSLTDACERTAQAMRSGVDVVYQAALFDGRWLGYADFLLRSGRPSGLGAFSYEVADTKLARKVKAAALLQMCSYAEQLERLQGVAPERLHVIVGDKSDHEYRLASYAAYYRAAKRRFEETVETSARRTYPDPTEHCTVCRWIDVCDARRRADDHLSFVAGLSREQTRKLAVVGITRLAELARSAAPSVPGIGLATLDKIRRQAELQLQQRTTHIVISELLTPEAGRGLALLPPPSSGDLFFDMESDPWAEDGGLDYLFGVVDAITGEPVFTPLWAHDRAGEKTAFERFIDLATARLNADPGMHIYHYGQYEVTHLKALMGLHATREEEVDRLLRGGVLVDLFQVVRQAVRVSQESYSIKMLEPLYMAPRETSIKGGGSSIVAYEEWIESKDQAILDAIAAYNRDDCVSTWRLRDWLETQRSVAEAKFGLSIERPPKGDPAPSAAVAEEQHEVARLAAALCEGIPDDPEDRDNRQQARWLLAQLLSWHRREAKPEYWAFYHRMTLSDEELKEDADSIGGLTFLSAGPIARSTLREYEFDPTQEHKFHLDATAFDPQTRKSAGTIELLDNQAGRVALKRQLAADEAHPTSLVPGPPIDTSVMSAALRRVASWVVANGIEGAGPYRAARDLLLRLPPRIEGLNSGDVLAPDGSDMRALACRIVTRLRETTLPVQGPPGSGKTFTGADMAVELLQQGRRIGVTCHSHRAITNFLDAVCRIATERGVSVRGLQRGPSAELCASSFFTEATTNGEIDKALANSTANLVAGTAWVFARPQMEGTLDTLFIDEAGQLSLANAVAMTGSAKNLVLLGDPNQLAQPSKGVHPQGAGLSPLEHVIGERQTIAPHQGLFLGTSWRLHPDVCSYISEVFYEDRLRSEPGCARQAVVSDGPLGGTGLRFLPVAHAGNRTTSSEEVEEVATAYQTLLEGSWVDRDGRVRPISQQDILVVAPYNAHVTRLKLRLGAAARVGTVDKFQGQEAAVVIFSMATSSVDDVPRNMEFLYSTNRLNVAISRALALAVLVCSPRLLQVRCRTPEQMRLANALCRFVEVASAVMVPA